MAKKRKKGDREGFSLTRTMLDADASVLFGPSTPFAKPIKKWVGEKVGDAVHYATGQDDFADAAERGAALATGLVVNKLLLDPVGAGKTIYDAAIDPDHPFDGLKEMADDAMQSDIPGSRVVDGFRKVAGAVDDAMEACETGQAITKALPSGASSSSRPQREPTVGKILKGAFEDAAYALEMGLKLPNLSDGVKFALEEFVIATQERYELPSARELALPTTEGIGKRISDAEKGLKKRTEDWIPVREDAARSILGLAEGARQIIENVEDAADWLKRNLG